MLLFNYLTIIIDIFNFYLVFISSFLFTLSLILIYLDGYNLSDIKFIKYIQIFSFVCIPFYIIYNLYDVFNFCLLDIISYATDNNDNKDINLHGHVSVNAEAGKAISQGLQTIGSQIGLGATIAGVSAAVSKAVAKTGMPPLQKAGAIVGSGILGGIGHSLISNVNRNAVNGENTINSAASSTNINSQVHKFIGDSHLSSLQEFLSDEGMMNYICLSLIYLLIIQLVFKLYFKNEIILSLSNLLNYNINKKIEFYLNKIINLNKQMSIMWIWYIFVTILIGLSISAYALHNVYAYIENYINGHISFYPNLITDNKFNPAKSINDILLNLKLINYISIITTISLMGLVMSKFHLNKNVNNIYIWLTILILILTLAFSAYTFNELYTNLNSYVKLYLNSNIK